MLGKQRGTAVRPAGLGLPFAVERQTRIEGRLPLDLQYGAAIDQVTAM